MINRTFEEEINRLDPLKVYHILQQHDLLNIKLARYKPIVNNNIQSIFAAAGNLAGIILHFSRKLYFKPKHGNLSSSIAVPPFVVSHITRAIL